MKWIRRSLVESSSIKLVSLNALFDFFSDISERNNDYSDTLDFRRGWAGVVTQF